MIFNHNLFEHVTHQETFEIIKSKTPSYDGNQIWNGKGLYLLWTVLEVLFFLKENNIAEITYSNIFLFMKLDSLKGMLDLNIPLNMKAKISIYLSSLPRHNEEAVHLFIINRFNNEPISSKSKTSTIS